MAKKVTGYIKLQIPAGKATPAPPVGPALGQHGVKYRSVYQKSSTPEPLTGRSDHPRCHHCICGQKLQLHHQDPACSSSAEESLQPEIRVPEFPTRLKLLPSRDLKSVRSLR